MTGNLYVTKLGKYLLELGEDTTGYITFICILDKYNNKDMMFKTYKLRLVDVLRMRKVISVEDQNENR